MPASYTHGGDGANSHSQGVNLTVDDGGRERWSDSVTIGSGNGTATSLVRWEVAGCPFSVGLKEALLGLGSLLFTLALKLTSPHITLKSVSGAAGSVSFNCRSLILAFSRRTVTRSDTLAQARLVETGQVHTRALVLAESSRLSEVISRLGEEGSPKRELANSTNPPVGSLASAGACRLSERPLSLERGSMA
ncbi:hypothetical protein DEO72_LG7g1705 [Vigna unguiculata]|uniref:Uncharacterized protein n=1 Tax=Vigna unguiculata TaxID=3917 RepID=A0A4D6MKX6_VIGUN|nr:hypothetical protein DEO72_LG7g1705 [Vigna unguiculata]